MVSSIALKLGVAGVLAFLGLKGGNALAFLISIIFALAALAEIYQYLSGSI